MSEQIECPYCDAEIDCNDEDCNETSENYESECPKCGKSYTFTVDWSKNIYPAKADCLNDGKHDWKPNGCYPKQYSRMRCSMCNDQRDCTPDELSKIMEGETK